MQEITPGKEEKEPISEKEEVRREVVEEGLELYEREKEKPKKPEEKEAERAMREKLEKEIEEMQISPELTVEARKKAKKIKDLDQKGKIKRLLEIAQEKGVSFAVEVAKDTKDPFILDIFHDILAKEGLYKKFRS
jgi:hypothetical protein